MITVYNNKSYRITYDGVSMVENALGNPNMIQISVAYGCEILVAPNQYGVAYMPNGDFRKWYITSPNPYLNRTEAHHIYVKLSRDGSDGMIVFSVNDYDFDGKIIGDSTSVANETFFYQKIGSITATDTATPPTIKREISYDGGYLNTPQYNEDAGGWKDLFAITSDNLIRALKHFASLTVKGTLYVVGNIALNSKLISDVAIRTDADDESKIGDSILASTGWIDASFGNLDEKYLRKDKKDFAHKHITFEEGITVYELAEMMNLDVKNLATIAKAVVSILRSSKFVDGFSGEGYQVWQDIASGDWNLTIDRVTVRKVMTIYELIIQKIRSVGGMVAVSAANGKVKTVDKIGNQYLFTFEDANQFQPNDLMRCQVFTGKDVKYYWVKVATVSGESVMVPVSEFAGVVPAVGDECVLMGNTTNKRRQSLIIISATEDGQPRFDCLNGVKTKSFEGCLKVRVGNLDGISDSRFPENMQPSDHGIYGNNCFLTGVFVLSNGKDVMTMFSIMEGMIKSEISSVRQEINEKDNYLSNAAFTKNIAGWQGNSNIRIFSVNGKLLMFNNNFYANKEAFANVISKDNQNVLRLKNSSITQLNADFSKKPVFDEYVQEDAEGNPILDANGNPVKLMRPRMFYVSFRYMVDRPGTLKVYFKGENKAGFEEYTSINYSEYIESGTEFKVMEIAGKWSGTGDFYLSFTGDMYLFSLALADNRLSDMEEKFTMRFEATDKKIQANLGEINKTGEKLEEYHSEFLLTAREMNATFTRRIDDVEDAFGQFKVDAERTLSIHGDSINAANSAIDGAYRAIGYAQRDATDALNSSLENATALLQTKSDISAIAGRFDKDGNLIEGAGWVTNADANNLWVKKDGVISSINQTAESVSIDASKINLNGTVTANGYFKIHLDGSMEASAGTIGGFEIGSNRIGSVISGSDSGGGLAIYDHLFRVGGNEGHVLFGNDIVDVIVGGAFTATGRIVNRAASDTGDYGLETSNYGLLIEVTGGTKNYGISSNAAILAPAFVSTKAQLLTVQSGTNNVDFSQKNIILLYSYYDTTITLPTEKNVTDIFGLKSLPIDFAAVVTFRARPGTSLIRIAGVYDHNENYIDIDLRQGDSIQLLITKVDGFRYQVLNWTN